MGTSADCSVDTGEKAAQSGGGLALNLSPTSSSSHKKPPRRIVKAKSPSPTPPPAMGLYEAATTATRDQSHDSNHDSYAHDMDPLLTAAQSVQETAPKVVPESPSVQRELVQETVHSQMHERVQSAAARQKAARAAKIAHLRSKAEAEAAAPFSKKEADSSDAPAPVNPMSRFLFSIQHMKRILPSAGSDQPPKRARYDSDDDDGEHGDEAVRQRRRRQQQQQQQQSRKASRVVVWVAVATTLVTAAAVVLTRYARRR